MKSLVGQDEIVSSLGVVVKSTDRNLTLFIESSS